MKAVISTAASPTRPYLTELPTPVPGPGEVLVQIKAAALNHRDLLYFVKHRPAQAPDMVVGSDAAGVVAALGDGVSGWQPGDRVLLDVLLSCGECAECQAGQNRFCAKLGVLGGSRGGTLAEYVAVPAVNLHRIPAHLDFTQAAALPMAVSTAWHSLIAVGKLQAGETVLIHGIGGGVALVALQIAVAKGARVIVTSGSDEKLARAQRLGAAAGVNYRTEDVGRRVRELTDGRGADVILIGIPTEQVYKSSVAALSRTGRAVRFGWVPEKMQLSASDIPEPIFKGGMAHQPEFAAAMAFVAESRLESVISQVLPLAEFEQGLEAMAAYQLFGKVVLTVR